MSLDGGNIKTGKINRRYKALTYADYRKAKQQEINDLPIFWAFSNEQFKKAMEERGLTENDTDKVYSLGQGGFYLRADAEKVRTFFMKPDELPELMESDPAFAEEAFYYEMCNHEYCINTYQGAWDVCSCFSSKELDFSEDKTFADYLREAGYSEKVIDIYRKARKKYFKAADENDWY